MKAVFILTILLAYQVSESIQCERQQVWCDGFCDDFCSSPFELDLRSQIWSDVLDQTQTGLTDLFSGITDLFSRWRNKRAVGDVVYRVLRRTERPENGLTAKDPSAQKTVQSHVGCGCRRNYRSQYISTTSDYDKALHYGGRSRIVEIDLNLARSAGCEVIDLTEGGDLVGTARNFAIASQEVLITGHIPANAVRLVRPGSG